MHNGDYCYTIEKTPRTALMMNNFTRNTLFSIFLIGILLLMIGGMLFFQQYQKIISTTDNINTSTLTLRAANAALSAINEATLDVTSFINTSDPNTIKNLSQITVIAQVNLKTLQQLTDDDKYQQILMQQLLPLVDQQIAFLNKLGTQIQSGDVPSTMTAAATNRDNVPQTQKIVSLISLIKHIEINQLNGFTSDSRHLINYSIQLFIITGLICELLFVFSYIGLRRYVH
jgi:CHASE3 domain sensor protein